MVDAARKGSSNLKLVKSASDGPKKPTTIEDFLKDIRTTKLDKLEDAFAGYDAFTHPDEIDRQYNDVFAPGMDAFYNTFVTQMSSKFGADKTSLEKKDEDKLKEAAAEALLKYFEKTSPAVVKAMEKLGIKGAERFDYLNTHFSAHHVDKEGRPYNIESLIKSLIENKEANVGTAKRIIGQSRGEWAQGGMRYLQSQASQRYFGHFHQAELAAYNIPKLEKAGIKIIDPLKFAQQKREVQYALIPDHLNKGGQLDYASMGLERAEGQKAKIHDLHAEKTKQYDKAA